MGNEGIDRVHFAWVSLIYRIKEEKELRSALEDGRKMSVRESGEPEALRRLETLKVNSTREIYPAFARRNDETGDTPGIHNR